MVRRQNHRPARQQMLTALHLDPRIENASAEIPRRQNKTPPQARRERSTPSRIIFVILRLRSRNREQIGHAPGARECRFIARPAKLLLDPAHQFDALERTQPEILQRSFWSDRTSRRKLL